MTSITPLSFVDDGLSFSRRMPRRGGRWDINKWLEGTSVAPSTLSTTDTSFYTGSFVDDGADMLAVDQLNLAPGFGRIDNRFHRKEKKRVDREVWTEDMAKAVGGDIWMSLGRIRMLGDLKVVENVEKMLGPKKEGKERGVGEVAEDGGIWVKRPLNFGAFVIEGDDGRIVVVEEDGEYDSGRLGEIAVGLGKSKAEKKEEKQRKREETRKRKEGASAKRNEEPAARHKRTVHKKSRCRQGSTITTEPLAPILEADITKDDSVIPFNALSPTNFFMTGGASGWPSLVPSLVKLCASPTRSPPGAWPSPVLSPDKPNSRLRWSRGSPTRSASTSTAEPVNTWKEQETRIESETTTKQTSVGGSHRSGTQSSSGNEWGAQKVDVWTRDSALQPAQSPTKPVPSHISSETRSKSKSSWKHDIEDVYSHVSETTVASRTLSAAEWNAAWVEPITTQSIHSHTKSRSARSRAPSTTATATVKQSLDKPTSTCSSKSSHSSHKIWTWHNTPSCSGWNAPPTTEPDTRCTHSSQRSSAEGSQVSTVQPFSWHRDVEEQSTYSTKGSSGSRSYAESVRGANTRQEDDKDHVRWKQDTDTRSVRSSHSTYHHATVEDAPPTPAEELQEWGPIVTSNTGWGDIGSDADTDKTTAWNGSQHGSNGSAKSQRNKSGYSEDNETWLNTEVGGVKFREAEWRRPGAISWKDVEGCVV
jgi:hypothetical protein